MATIPTPYNEPIYDYAKDSDERAKLEEAISSLRSNPVEIPIVAGDAELKTGEMIDVVEPHKHASVIARAHEASPEHVQQAIDAAMKAAPGWAATSLEDRASIFLRASELITTRYRGLVNASCMLGQSKTAHQAEIDSICELVDFWRFNVSFMADLEQQQPTSSRGIWNRLDYRPLEGFVFAITPFNFLAIAANLPTAPIIAGNVAVWKPANVTLRGCWAIMEILREAGLPPGVLNMVPGAGPAQGAVALGSEHLAGIHFTGSTPTFKHLWRAVSENLDTYRAYPRLVGETGGKDFIVAHESAHVASLATAITRGGFEYQGQKCSAASRIYVPKAMWESVKELVVADLETIRFGDVSDFSNFGGAVIDERAFDKIAGYVDLAKESANVVFGGTYDKSEGYFIQPTLVEVDDPKHRLMQEEIFGPVVTVYPYEQSWSEVLELVDSTSPYGLTGAVFANDRRAVRQAQDTLRQSAGNFYINDKPTGAVVGQQPFGGGRQSGTNDKAGFHYNMLRWLSPRSIKETFSAATDYRYPFLDQ